MNRTNINKNFFKFSPYIIGVILILLPFHAFLTIWASTLVGQYTILRLWKEILIILLIIPAIILTLRKYYPKNLYFNNTLLYFSLFYVFLNIVTGVLALKYHHVNLKAFSYGLLVNSRFILFFWLCLIVSNNTKWLKNNWLNLLIIPGLIVILFGLIQHYILPADFLTHFGYNLTTITPYQLVDSNSLFVRIQSTLRGANPLGAYLVLLLPAVLYRLYKSSELKDKIIWALFSISTFIVLFYSYSRSAYIAVLLALFMLLWLLSTKQQKKILIVFGLVSLGIVTYSYMTFRHNLAVENTLLHTSSASSSAQSSNFNHLSATKGGINDSIHHPLGDGTGTAGPASVYNNQGARIAENYYIQIAQENGLIGLVLFVGIIYGIGKYLYIQRKDALSMILFVSLIGISFINLLSHAWADDTLSLLWFGLAGIALAPRVFNDSFSLKK